MQPGNPYTESENQDGFGTFGAPHVLSLVTEVATRALKAVWHQKWNVHRRLRPEEFGGRIHVHLSVSPRYPMIEAGMRNTGAGGILNRVLTRNTATGNQTFLLPLAFPEGSPIHPSYGAGHATVAGACVTILKAWFDETFPLPGPVYQANAAGTALEQVAGSPPLTVAGELNKLAANISIGRNGAGVHWRSDYTESIRLGEQIAIGTLEEQRLTYNEDHRFTCHVALPSVRQRSAHYWQPAGVSAANEGRPGRPPGPCGPAPIGRETLGRSRPRSAGRSRADGRVTRSVRVGIRLPGKDSASASRRAGEGRGSEPRLSTALLLPLAGRYGAERRV